MIRHRYIYFEWKFRNKILIHIPPQQIVIDQPTELCECKSDNRFKKQISHNYDIMFKKLEEMDCGCSEQDITEFKELLNKMRNEIVDIVDAYFKCDRNDPTEAIEAAIDCYDSTRKVFRLYGRNAFNKFSPKCNSAIQYVRQLPYISAENTIMSMLTCAKLKSK